MTSSYQSRLGTAPEESIKAPVRVETAMGVNIALTGEQTVNSVAVVVGDRVFVKDQTVAAENGIYDVTAGAWTRSTDWNDGQDIVSGMLIPSSESNLVYMISFSGDYTVGVSTFAVDTVISVAALASQVTDETKAQSVQASLDGLEETKGTVYDDLAALKAATGHSVGDRVQFWRNGVLTEVLAVASGGADELGQLAGVGIDWKVQTPHVNSCGAVANNATDSTGAMQAAYNLFAGQSIAHSVGTYRTALPLSIKSDTTLQGVGLTATYIKPLNSAAFAEHEAVIQSEFFPAIQGTNKWDYYDPIPAGLTMGIAINGIAIDGNRASVANAGGLNIYGGKWNLQNVAVINTDSHAIWTEAGRPISSTSGDDLEDYINMHESFADNIYICNANKHGWLYRGPNDSYVDHVQIKTCGWGGFIQDEDDGSFSLGGLKIGTLHAYACDCNHVGYAAGYMYALRSALVDRIYIDSSKKGGLFLDGGVQINQAYGASTNTTNGGDFWTVLIDSPAAYITQLVDSNGVARTSGTHGGTLSITATGSNSTVAAVRATRNAGSTINSTGIKVRGAGTQILSGFLFDFDVAGDSAVDLSASDCNINVQILQAETGVNYDNTSTARNRLNIGFRQCTNDIATSVPVKLFDKIEYTTDSGDQYAVTKAAVLDVSHMRMSRIATNYAATVTPSAESNSSIRIGTLTGDIVINAPSGVAQDGDVLEFIFQQDGTGSRAVTWDTAYKTNFNGTGNAAFKRASVRFKYDGGFWVQIGGFSGWL